MVKELIKPPINLITHEWKGIVRKVNLPFEQPIKGKFKFNHGIKINLEPFKRKELGKKGK